MSLIVKLILGAAVLYGIVVVAFAVGQRRLLYHPPPDPPTAATLRARGLDPWGEHAVRHVPEAVGVAVVFHGNAGGAADRVYFADALGARSLTVVLAEYPGYAGRGGAPSQASLVADGVAVLVEAHAEFGGPMTVWGESLGAGVAAAVLAQTEVPVAGAVLVTPWATLPDLAADHYPWLPVRTLLRDRYDNLSNLRAWGGTVGVALAERDQVIPPCHAERLAAAVGAAAWRFPDAGHNSWPTAPAAAWWDEAVALALGASTPGTTAPGVGA